MSIYFIISSLQGGTLEIKPVADIFVKLFCMLKVFGKIFHRKNGGLDPLSTLPVLHTRINIRAQILFCSCRILDSLFSPRWIDEFDRIKMNVCKKILQVFISRHILRLECSLEERPDTLVFFIKVHCVSRRQFPHKLSDACIICCTDKQMEMIRHQYICTHGTLCVAATLGIKHVPSKQLVDGRTITIRVKQHPLKAHMIRVIHEYLPLLHSTIVDMVILALRKSDMPIHCGNYTSPYSKVEPWSGFS